MFRLNQLELQSWANKIGAKYQELTKLYQQDMEKSMISITKYLQNKYELPNNWKVYQAEVLDGEGEKIIRLKGRNTRVLKRGKNIGQIKYDGGCQKTYLMQLSEYHSVCNNQQ